MATRKDGLAGENSFLYEAFNKTASIVLAAGDRLVYDVRTVDSNVAFGLDGLLTNTSAVTQAMRDCGTQSWPTIADQNGYGIHPASPGPGVKSSVGWYTRSFSLNAYAGYTLSNFAFGFESDTVNGPQVGYIHNARVESNTGVVKLAIFNDQIVTTANTPWLEGAPSAMKKLRLRREAFSNYVRSLEYWDLIIKAGAFRLLLLMPDWIKNIYRPILPK